MADNNNQAFNAFINHLMANKGTCCHAPANRYCAVGRQLKDAYSKECNRGYYDFQSNRKR